MNAPDFEPLEGLPPARRSITAALLSHGWERGDVEEAIANYASELADEIRKERDVMQEQMKTPGSLIRPDDLKTLAYAASLIDPYAAGLVDE